MGNLSSVGSDRSDEDYAITRAERWVLAKRCVSLLQTYFPDTKLDTVLLLPKQAFFLNGKMPTFEEAKPYLRPVLSLSDKKEYPMGPGRAVYVSHVQVDHIDRRWVPGTARTTKEQVAAKAAAAAALAASGAVAVAVAAAAAGAAQAAAGAAIQQRASAAGEAADLYVTARAFLVENPEFQHVWVSSACMPPRLRDQKWRGAVPSASGSNMFEHMHPGALLACDAVLVVPPERESMSYVAEQRQRYSDLEMFSTSPWKTLEGAITQLINNVSFYAFRLGDQLVFAGPYPSYAEEPQPSPLDTSRRSSAPSASGGDERGPPVESPVERARAAAKLLLPRMGWNSKSDNSHHSRSDHSHHSISSRRTEVSRWNRDDWEAGGGGRSRGSTPTASVTTASASDSSGGGHHGGGREGRRKWEIGGEGSRIERAVGEALERLEISGSGLPPERNWRGVLQPSLVLQKAREDVEKYSDARGALKQAMCSMSVSIDQAEEFFVVWKQLKVLGPCVSEDRLAALNLLLFAVSVADGHCCPRRQHDFVHLVMEESLVTPGHLDLWMKDLSPDDSRNILRTVNASGTKLGTLTVGSSHTAGAGVGTFLMGHPTLTELELEWEGVRDLSSISRALMEHKSLTRLNLTHNEIGHRGALQLAGALRQNKSLTELDLRENSLGQTGMKEIADALASNETMRTLHLQDNEIGDDGVIAMTEALMRNGRLRTVCLDGNNVSDVGAKVICIAIKMNLALQLLSLSRNALSDKSKRALYDAWSQREVEDGQTRSGMYLDQAAEGTATGRESWKNGLPPVGVFVSNRPGGSGAGVLVSPTHEQLGGIRVAAASKRSGAGSSNGATSASRAESNRVRMMPAGFSPVHDSFVKKPLW